jgi:hypothetical protein
MPDLPALPLDSDWRRFVVTAYDRYLATAEGIYLAEGGRPSDAAQLRVDTLEARGHFVSVVADAFGLDSPGEAVQDQGDDPAAAEEAVQDEVDEPVEQFVPDADTDHDDGRRITYAVPDAISVGQLTVDVEPCTFAHQFGAINAKLDAIAEFLQGAPGPLHRAAPPGDVPAQPAPDDDARWARVFLADLRRGFRYHRSVPKALGHAVHAAGREVDGL